jgi:hypothetical protein
LKQHLVETQTIHIRIRRDKMKSDRTEEESSTTIDEEATEAAATALTALSLGSKAEDEDGDESFKIPQKFTKSGRTRATPFTLKVRKSEFGPTMVLPTLFSFLTLCVLY